MNNNWILYDKVKVIDMAANAIRYIIKHYIYI